MSVESDQTAAKSYRYLRIAMIGVLLALAASVFYQSSQQGSFLASVSAYYYTSAQGVFVGALIGLGVSMIVLQGMNNAENMFLNLGGMFAIVVAIVPTGRGSDFDTAVQACRKSGGTLLTHRASSTLDCPTVNALQEAARTNVENNMAALLIVGGLALILAAVILVKSWDDGAGTAGRKWALAGLSVAVLLWAAGLIALLVSVDWVAGNAHYIAAISLGVCILIVVEANARRHQERGTRTNAENLLLAYRYTWIGVVMLVGTGVLIGLWLAGVISLFWVEISVALMFILFWTVQTLETDAQPSPPPAGRLPDAGRPPLAGQE
jgi:hypothetical protein